MKANEFVKRFGINKAKGITCVMISGTVNYDGISVDYNDLKRLVESHELVESYGGISELRREKILAWELNMPRTYELLRKAIKDVESCI